jgi:hypothetical protein
LAPSGPGAWGHGGATEMSHVPLLSRQTVPKLQSTRRGPQMALLCLVATVVFLLLPQDAHAMLSWNATRVREEPPPAVRRVVDAANHHRLLTAETMEDLLATVGHLAQREFGLR